MRWNEAVRPDAVAIVLGSKRLTFADLAHRVRGAAHALTAHGVGPGDHVALIGTNSIDWILVFLATTTLGATVVPVNTRLTDAEIAWTVRASDAQWVVFMPRYRRRSIESLPESLNGHLSASRFLTIVESLDGLEEAIGVPTREEAEAGARPDNTATILYTSGSTAAPKGCLLREQGMIRNGCQHVDRLGITFKDRWFSSMPLFHAGGLVWGLTSILVSGATLVTHEVFEPGEALDLIERERCTYHHGVDPMFYKEMAHPSFRRERLESVRVAASLGTPELLRRIHDDMGIPGIVPKWGISEGYGNLTLGSPTEPLERRLNTHGRGYAGIEYRIADPETGSSLPTGKVGEILVRGSVMDGYYKDPDATRAVVDSDGWLYSGDLGRFDADGYLTFTGRKKEMVKVGGENVSVAEVESAIAEHPSVGFVAVVAAPHESLGEVPVAFVVADSTLSIDALSDFVRARLAPFKVPAKFVRVEAGDLEYTASEKLVKRSLYERARTLDLA